MATLPSLVNIVGDSEFEISDISSISHDVLISRAFEFVCSRAIQRPQAGNDRGQWWMLGREGQMDFSLVARSARTDIPGYYGEFAAAVVSNANPSTLLDRNTGRVAAAARESAAVAAALVRTVSHRYCISQGTSSRVVDKGSAVHNRGADRWGRFDAGLQEVQAQLDRKAVPSHVFQAQLLSILRHEDFMAQPLGVGTVCEDLTEEQDAVDLTVHRLAAVWRLHVFGLLPLSRLLEAHETSPTRFFVGRGSVAGEQHHGWLDEIGRGMLLSASHLHAHMGSVPPNAAAIFGDVARYLFDLGYPALPVGGTVDHINCAGGGQAADSLSSRAARRVLDRLCSGPDVFDMENMAGLQACLAVFTAIAPTVACYAPSDSQARETESTTLPMAGDIAIVTNSGGAGTKTETPTNLFLGRQLRLLMENASGHIGGEDRSEVDARARGAGAAHTTLIDVMRCFSSPQFVEALRSTCRKTIGLAADATGSQLHQPLLRWGTLAPIVNAAATAYPRETPLAIAHLATELAETALNLGPSQYSGSNRLIACNHQQGLLILATALRLVAEADVCPRATETTVNEERLYSRWFRSCFGVALPSGDGTAAHGAGEIQARLTSSGQGSENAVPEDQESIQSVGGFSDVLQEAMGKQCAAAILMEALCISVPSDPEFVLEVHRDVLKTRLRAKFSGQLRDLIHLVVTRLSDINVQSKARKRRAQGARHTSGSRNSVGGALHERNGDDVDPTSREVGFFLRHFQQTGEVSPALRTAILWQPNSWAKLRKVLFAPPGERIVMSDAKGSAVAITGGWLSEALGRGEGGLHVEVSLKYRLLLVKQLAKDSLLSTQECDAFKKTVMEHLQGQRNTNMTQSTTSEDVGVTVRQLWLLEAQLNPPVGNCDRVPAGNGLCVQERLVVLLQEYFPRALVLELAVEGCENGSGNCTVPATRSGAGVTAGENVPHSPLHHDWFAIAAHRLAGVLGEWNQGYRRTSYQAFSSPSQLSSPAVKASNSQLTVPSAEEVAEAVLNSIHCCVAAVGATLGQEFPTSWDGPFPPNSDNLTAREGSLCTKREPGNGSQTPKKVPAGEENSCAAATTPFRANRVARALRFIGQIVSIAVGVDALHEALAGRTFSLLMDPGRLDPRQLVSLAHIVASLPPNFRPRVERVLTDLIERTLRPSAAIGSQRSDAKTNEGDVTGLRALVQFGALYVQSALVLHERICVFSPKEDCDARFDGAGRGTPDAYSKGSTRMASIERGSRVVLSEVGYMETPCAVGKESECFVPVRLLDFLWWMERRLFVAQSTEVDWRVGCGTFSQTDVLPLLRVLQSVVKHPRFEFAFKLTFGSPNATMPPLERLIALEAAVSDEIDFCKPRTKHVFLKHVTLGRLVNSSAGSERHSDVHNGAIIGSCVGDLHGGSGVPVSVDRSAPNAETEDIAEDVKAVWKACVACLFKESSLREAAHQRIVCQDSWGHGLENIQSAGFNAMGIDYCGRRGEVGELTLTCDIHRSWRESVVSRECDGDATVLLDSMLQVMGQLCNFEALACEIGRGRKRDACLHKTTETRRAEESIDRKPSALIQMALSLAMHSPAATQATVAPALILIADVAIPEIRNAEGNGIASDALSCLWRDYLCRLRPLEPGAVAVLTRIAVMSCHSQPCAGQRDRELEGCHVEHMLEGLPLLTAEMVRIWPRLIRTLQPVLGVTGDVSGQRASGEWHVHLATLHRLGCYLVEDLVGGMLQRSETAESLCIPEPPSVLSMTRTATNHTVKGGAHARIDGREPLGSMRNGIHSRRERHEQTRGAQILPVRDAQGTTRGIGNRMSAQEDTAASAAPIIEGPPELDPATAQDPDRLRRAAAAMHRSCAEVIVGVVDAAAALLIKSRRKRPRQPSVVAVGSGKRGKVGGAWAVTAVETPGRLTNGSTIKGPQITVASQLPMSSLRPPSSEAWATCLLDPVYGPIPEASVSSPLLSLLEALIKYIAKTSAISKGALMCEVDAGHDKRGAVARCLAVSLTVTIIGSVKALFVRLLDAPFLESSTVVSDSGKTPGQSFAVLECLKRLAEEPTLYSPLRRKLGSAAWLTVVLSHYRTAWRFMSGGRRGYEEGDTSVLPDVDSWTTVVAFVHRNVGDVAAEELRLIPVAVAVQEVDPSLKQYF